jgi:UDP-N-acetylmuramyl pentapeptide synthase
VVNGDDKYLKTMQSTDSYRVIRYGIENMDAEIKAEDISADSEAAEFYCGNKKFRLNSIGRHNIYNALCAMAIGRELGLSDEMISSGFLDYRNENMRMQQIRLKGSILFINDAYNANYDSMKAGIEAVAGMKAARRIIVLGDMFELGEFSKELHQSIGELFRENTPDILVTCGKEAAEIANAAKKYAGDCVYHLENKADVIHKLKAIVREGDIVYFKASRGMKFEEIINPLADYFNGNN